MKVQNVRFQQHFDQNGHLLNALAQKPNVVHEIVFPLQKPHRLVLTKGGIGNNKILHFLTQQELNHLRVHLIKQQNPKIDKAFVLNKIEASHRQRGILGGNAIVIDLRVQIKAVIEFSFLIEKAVDSSQPYALVLSMDVRLQQKHEKASAVLKRVVLNQLEDVGNMVAVDFLIDHLNVELCILGPKVELHCGLVLVNMKQNALKLL